MTETEVAEVDVVEVDPAEERPEPGRLLWGHWLVEALEAAAGVRSDGDAGLMAWAAQEIRRLLAAQVRVGALLWQGPMDDPRLLEAWEAILASRREPPADEI